MNDIFDLFSAFKSADPQAVNALLDQYQYDLEKTYENGRTLLYYAAFQNNVALARLLLDRGAKVEAQDDIDRTILHCAAYFNSVDVATVLVSAGANLDAKDKLGLTPLHQAVRGASLAAVQYLLSKGADANLLDNEQNAALDLLPSEQVCLFDSVELLMASDCVVREVEINSLAENKNRSLDIKMIAELLTASRR